MFTSLIARRIGKVYRFVQFNYFYETFYKKER